MLTSGHDFPMIEHTLREGLAGGMRAQLSVESERLGDREVSLDSEHRCSGTLLFGKDLATTFVQARVDTTNGVFRALNLDCNGGQLKLRYLVLRLPR